MKLIFFEKNFIVIFGFFIAAFLQSRKVRKAVTHTHNEIVLLRRKSEKPYDTGFSRYRKKNESCNTFGIITFVLIWLVAPKKIFAYLLLYAYVNITGFGCDLTFSA